MRVRRSSCTVAPVLESDSTVSWPDSPGAPVFVRPPPRRIVVDAEGYRERRETILRRQAEHAADDALRQGRPGS